MANKKIFTNTYITGEGRRNYLTIDKLKDYKDLEDPLFTSFTLDIDFNTSPLFYSINDYSNLNDAVGIAKKIEDALAGVHGSMKNNGYDILPVNSAFKLGNDKLGFGIQQNVYMDKPLYGAIEYIYMVDKRNGTEEQNDVASSSLNDDGTVNIDKSSFSLGNSVNDIVNESDKQWAENRKKQAEAQETESQTVLDKQNVKDEHDKNKSELDGAKKEYEGIKYEVDENGNITLDGDDVNKYSDKEKNLQEEINKFKQIEDKFNELKNNIAKWVNDEIKKTTNDIKINGCVEKISKYENLNSLTDEKKNEHYDSLVKDYGDDFVKTKILEGDGAFMSKIIKKFNSLVSCIDNNTYTNGEINEDSLLIEDGKTTVRDEKILNKYKKDLIACCIIEKDATSLPENCIVQVNKTKSLPEAMSKLVETSGFVDFVKYCNEKSDDEVSDVDSICDDFVKMTKALMSYQCDVSSSFMDFDKIFEGNFGKKLGELEAKMSDLRSQLEAAEDKYNAAKEKYENDDYSTAEKSKKLAEEEKNNMESMLKEYERNNKKEDDGDSDGEDKKTDPKEKQSQTVATETQKEEPAKPAVAPQTVLDMIGFKSGMKKLTEKYPYIINYITGLDTAYNKNYGIKDPYLGSGDDKITITCWESLDLRVSSMFNRYFNAAYDRQYRRERVPVNLRRFNCSVYVHDVRNFFSRRRDPGNRILELTDMYYSVIEFRFYDCEIVPEETGNIFNDISNEAPSEMKKTNFTFTYGNCIVNFVPHSEVKGK